LVKIVRVANDNVASIFYNETQSLAGYFWVGFGICLISFACSSYLIEIHELVFDPSNLKEQEGNKSDEVEEKKGIFS
jgi:amino acid permease